MTLSSRQQIFAQNVGHLLEYIKCEGYECTLGEALRTPEMAELYAKQGKGIRNSLHCKRLAIDLNLFKDGVYLPDTEDYRAFGEYWESLDPLNRWGGRFKDGGHFSMTDGITAG